MRTVIDTNVLLASISSKSAYHWIFQSIQEGRFEIAITTEILIEYEEQIARHWNTKVATTIIQSLLELPNAISANVFYKLNLIENDKDDNKFVDCAFAANAHYLVTEDRDFDVLKKITFPAISVVNLQTFKKILLSIK